MTEGLLGVSDVNVKSIRAAFPHRTTSIKKARVLHYDNIYDTAIKQRLNVSQSSGKPKLHNYYTQAKPKIVFNWECLNCNTTVSTNYSNMAQWNIVPRICIICQFPYSPYPAFRNLTNLTRPKDEPIKGSTQVKCWLLN